MLLEDLCLISCENGSILSCVVMRFLLETNLQ